MVDCTWKFGFSLRSWCRRLISSPLSAIHFARSKSLWFPYGPYYVCERDDAFSGSKQTYKHDIHRIQDMSNFLWSVSFNDEFLIQFWLTLEKNRTHSGGFWCAKASPRKKTSRGIKTLVSPVVGIPIQYLFLRGGRTYTLLLGVNPIVALRTFWVTIFSERALSCEFK